MDLKKILIGLGVLSVLMLVGGCIAIIIMAKPQVPSRIGGTDETEVSGSQAADERGIADQLRRAREGAE